MVCMLPGGLFLLPRALFVSLSLSLLGLLIISRCFPRWNLPRRAAACQADEGGGAKQRFVGVWSQEARVGGRWMDFGFSLMFSRCCVVYRIFLSYPRETDASRDTHIS